jgi:hypothetical protein
MMQNKSNGGDGTVNKKLRTIILLALSLTLILGIAGISSALGSHFIELSVEPVDSGTIERVDHENGLIELTAIPNPGWRFDHWTYDPQYELQLYSLSSESEDALINVNEPNVFFEYPADVYGIYFTAHFERHQIPQDNTYTVSYHPNGGTGAVPIDMNRYYPGEQAMLKSGAGLTMPGKVFAGWSLTGNEPIQMIPYTMGRSDVTFFAVWQPLTVPKTGDAPNALGVLLLVSGAALAALAVLRKRAESR